MVCCPQGCRPQTSWTWRLMRLTPTLDKDRPAFGFVPRWDHWVDLNLQISTPFPTVLCHLTSHTLLSEERGLVRSQSQRNLEDIFFIPINSKGTGTYFPLCNDQVILQILNVYVFWCDCTHGHELEQTLGDSEGQGSLACYSPWGCRDGHDLVTEKQHGKKRKENLKNLDF